MKMVQEKTENVLNQFVSAKKIVKMEGENMNLESFWSAFGSIGTMLACIIAVLQPIVERYIERKKKVIASFKTDRIVVLPSLDDFKQEICTVFLTNNGNSSIYVTNISLLVDGQYLHQIAVPGDPVYYQEFPKELRVGERLDFNFSKGKLHDQLQNFSAGLPVSVVVSFTDGKVYKQKTKSTVGDIINEHQCDYKVEKTGKSINKAEKASDRPSTFKKFSEATTSKHGFQAKISKENFAKAIDKIATYIFDNKNDDIELTKELVLLEANLSECQFADDFEASLRDTLSQFRTIIISVVTSMLSIEFFTQYEVNPLAIVITVLLLLLLYFILSFICTVIKGRMSKIFDTKLKKAIAITISGIIKSKENEKNTIKQEQIKTTICTNIALLQNT